MKLFKVKQPRYIKKRLLQAGQVLFLLLINVTYV